jgi:hypothetical protein
MSDTLEEDLRAFLLAFVDKAKQAFCVQHTFQQALRRLGD